MFEERNENLLMVDKNQLAKIKEAAQLSSEEQLNDYINEIQVWYGNQPHLPKEGFDRDVVERILISKHGSIEKTKTTLDAMFSIRSFLKDLAAPRDISNASIQRTFSAMVFTPLPKLNHDNTRVNLYRYTSDVESYNFQDFLNYVFMTMEYRLKCDYSAGDRSLIDFQHRTLAHMTKECPCMIKYCEIFVTIAYGIKILGIHVINAPSFLNSIMNVVKLGLSHDLSSMIHIHADYEDLYKYISKDILPKEYGGNEKSALDLVDMWKEEFSKKSIKEYLLLQERLRSDESKRTELQLNEDLSSISESFKTLEID